MTTTARAGSVFPAENRRHFWSADVHPETTIEDIERPAFWAHEAAKLRQFDRIEIRWEDGQKWADAIVLASGAGFARVSIVNMIDAAAGEDGAIGADAEDLLLITEIKWKGPTLKWAVIRTKDGHLISSGHDKIAAYAAAVQYEKTVHG